MKQSARAGFTFIEALIVLGILAVLVSVSVISLTGAQRTTSLTATVDTFISDMRGQQIKAMMGDTEGRGVASSYGIHFTSAAYTLFHGSGPGNPDDFVVTLDPGFQFTSIPSDIIFSQITGEVNTSGAVTITNSQNGEQKTITFNRYGVVTQVN